jgi:hypothetical protein
MPRTVEPFGAFLLTNPNLNRVLWLIIESGIHKIRILNYPFLY